MGQAARQGVAASSAYLGAKAGKNHYALTQDGGEAVWKGADSGRRWANWTFAWGYTIILAMIGVWSLMVVSADDYVSDDLDGDMRQAWGMLHAVPIQVLLLLVVYNRNIDYSLFNRRLLYWLIKPVQMLTLWLPTPVLYLGVVGLPFVLANL